MKLLSKSNEELVDVELEGGKAEPLKAHICIGDLSFNSPDVETEITKVDNDLQVSIRIPGLVNFKLLVEPDDVKALKGMMSKDVLKFMMKSFF